jgi:carbon monoxide dehydrogenase subunit G
MRGSLVFPQPPEEVFDAALDEPTWNPAMTSVEWLTPPPVGTGTRLRALMGGRLAMMVELTEVDRPHRIATHTSSAMLATNGSVTFVPQGAGTLLRWDWEYHLRGASRLLTPLFAVAAGRWERSNWMRMREWMAVRPPR